MKRLVIGTAGHIDHGKTTLIKALTGIETDATKEEQQRGLSINLGFAYLDLPSGERVGIVDVPGHERFIKNMVAGASGLDLILLVIDINEGIMAQTKEHVAILSMLGIKDYIIVLTKTDGADPELSELVEMDIRDQFEGTALEEAPIIKTDAITGRGIEELKQLIDEKTRDIRLDEANLPARLNVDRAFSVKGFGTVITGTLIEGKIHVGDELTIYPKGITTKVRSIQIHEEDQDVAYAGNRTALNLTKVSLDEVGRGDVLSASELEPTYMLDVKLTNLSDTHQPIELWDRVHVHIGTREVLARIVPLGVERIMPGEEGFAQLRLEEKIAVKRDDHFIIRSYSPVVTIGGGMVLDANPKKHRRFNEEVIESLEIKEQGDLSDIVLDFLDKRQYAMSGLREISDYLNEDLDQVDEAVSELYKTDRVMAFGNQYMSRANFDQLAQEMVDRLVQYHEQNPLRPGMPLEEFRSQYKKMTPKDLSAVINELRQEDRLVIEDEVIHTGDFQVKLSPKQQEMKDLIERRLLEARFTPPVYEDLIDNNKAMQAMLTMMIGEEVVQLDRYNYLHRSVYDEAVEKTLAHIKENGSITLAEFRDIMDTSRKYALLFLEHLDDEKITKRDGDQRVLY